MKRSNRKRHRPEEVVAKWTGGLEFEVTDETPVA